MINYSLRKIEAKDLKQILAWRNRENIRKCMINDSVISWEEHLSWFKRLANDKNREFLIFSISGKPVGIVNFVDINEQKAECFWGFYLGEKSCPSGSGLLMCYCGLDYIFSKFKISKIHAHVIEFNEISSNFHKRLLFQKKSFINNHIFRNGNSYNLLIYELLFEKWMQNRGDVWNYITKKINDSMSK